MYRTPGARYTDRVVSVTQRRPRKKHHTTSTKRSSPYQFLHPSQQTASHSFREREWADMACIGVDAVSSSAHRPIRPWVSDHSCRMQAMARCMYCIQAGHEREPSAMCVENHIATLAQSLFHLHGLCTLRLRAFLSLR